MHSVKQGVSCGLEKSFDAQKLRFMLDAGANIKTHGERAVRYAAYKGYLEAVKFLVFSGVDVNAEAYEKANSEADSEVDTEVDYIPPEFSDRERPVLQCAVESMNIGLVKSLLDMGADVNAIYYCYDDENGFEEDETALKIAVWGIYESVSHKVEMVQVLLAAGADVNIPEENRTSKSILEIAIAKNDEELICIFLKEGADINSPPKGYYGRSPIQRAVDEGNLSLIKLLLESGADINAPAGHSFGRTAIQAASSAYFPTMELIEFLLEAGAEINAPAGNKGGVTALPGAAIRGHMGIARRFLEAGADVNAAAAIIEGRTALDGAAEHGRLDMVQMLLNAGAVGDPRKSHRFESAIKLARENGHFAVASLLERA